MSKSLISLITMKKFLSIAIILITLASSCNKNIEVKMETII